VFSSDPRDKESLIDAYNGLSDRQKTVIATDVRETFRRVYNADKTTIFRSFRGHEVDMGGLSVTDERSTRVGTDVRAFEVSHSDVMLHYAQDESPLESRAFGHEREIILRPDANPIPI